MAGDHEYRRVKKKPPQQKENLSSFDILRKINNNV